MGGVHRLRRQQSSSAGSGGWPTMPPKGCMVVRVVATPGGGGAGEEEEARFVVPVGYLKHPLFVGLLKEAEEEYGFKQRGAITLPCGVDNFRRLQGIIDHHHHSSNSNGGGGGLLSGGAHHNGSGHFHIAACFRA